MSAESIMFSVKKDSTGVKAVKDFNYIVSSTTDSKGYSPNTTFKSDVTANSKNKLSGTFSGTLTPSSGTTNVVVTEGKFNLATK